MTTPAEARSPVTDQQQTAFERERVVEPERQDPDVAKTSPGEQVSSVGDGQPVSDREAQLERQLEQERQQRQQAEAELAHKREQARERQQRRRERNREQVRKQNAAYMRKWRARRKQGVPAADQQQPVLDPEAAVERPRAAERTATGPRRERQVGGAWQEQAKKDRQRELKNARQRRWRQAHPEETRQRKQEEQARARQQKQGFSVANQEQLVFDRVAELERRLAEAQTTLEQYEAKLVLQQATQERQQEQKRERWRRWRERHAEEDRQRSAAYRRRKRQEREQGRNPST